MYYEFNWIFYFCNKSLHAIVVGIEYSVWINLINAKKKKEKVGDIKFNSDASILIMVYTYTKIS